MEQQQKKRDGQVGVYAYDESYDERRSVPSGRRPYFLASIISRTAVIDMAQYLLLCRGNAVAGLLAAGDPDMAVGRTSHGLSAARATRNVLHIQRQFGTSFNEKRCFWTLFLM